MKCEVCGYEHSKAAFITLHIKREHNMDSKSYYTQYILKGEAPKCFCGKECKFDDIVHGYRKYCSLYCANTSNEKRDSVSRSRRDNWKESSEKYHNTCLKKYGKMSFVQTDEFKSKSRDSKRTNHNDENYNNRDLAKKTFLSKYGVDNYNKTEYAKEKNRDRMYNSDKRFGADSFKKRMKELYGYENAMQVPSIHGRALRNGKLNNRYEKKIDEFLRNRGFKYQYQYPVNGKMFDFAVFDKDDKLDLLIEIDGEYWHGINSDSDGIRVRGENDYERFLLCPENTKLIVCDGKNIESIFSEIMKAVEIDYEKWISDMLESLPKEFPYPSFSRDRLNLDYKHLKEYEYHKNSYIGTSIVKHYHKSIYDGIVGNGISPISAWNDKTLLEKVVRNRIIYKSNLSSRSIAEGFNIAGICKSVSIFNPIFAKDLLIQYAEQYNEIFDPFSGFSGRLLGTAVLGKSYIGQDINSKHVDESNMIISDFNLEKCKVTCEDIFNSTGEYECLFTCPPYNLKERWNPTDVNKSCDEWIDIILDRFKCKTYILVVDKTEKYKNHIVKTVENRSHFSNSTEYVLKI